MPNRPMFYWRGPSEPAPPTPWELFEWCVVRQSDLGPSPSVAAAAFGLTTREVETLVAAFNDPRGTLTIVRIKSGAPGRRIEAYYNTSGG